MTHFDSLPDDSNALQTVMDDALAIAAEAAYKLGLSPMALASQAQAVLLDLRRSQRQQDRQETLPLEVAPLAAEVSWR